MEAIVLSGKKFVTVSGGRVKTCAGEAALPKPDLSGVQVAYAGPMLSHSGYSKMNRELVLRLAAMGASVRAEPVETKVEVDQATVEAVGRLSATVVRSSAPCIHGMTVPMRVSGGRANILYSMIETSKGVHPEYAERMCLGTEVWVPSNYMKQILGPGTNVRVMPLGVDTTVFKPQGRKMSIPGARGFRFVSVFWWSYRKGYDVLLKAFAEAFTGDEDVTLVVSTKPHGGDYKAECAKIRAQVASLLRSNASGSLPNVILHFGHLTEHQLAALYRGCDAFILPSRGEGFGLPYFEAGACGLPVIASNCTAQSTLLDNGVAYMVNPDGYELASARSSVAALASWCRYYENQYFPVFGKTSVTAFASAMRSVFDGRREASEKARRLMERTQTSMTWDTAAGRVGRRLLELATLQ